MHMVDYMTINVIEQQMQWANNWGWWENIKHIEIRKQDK